MDAQAIIKALETRFEDSEVAQQLDDMAYSNGQELKQLEGEFGKVVLVDQHGGEGEGENYHKVYHFVDHDVYVRFDASYQSYDGTDFSGADLYQVVPSEKMVTEYKRK